jgi:hypothetical protein
LDAEKIGGAKFKAAFEKAVALGRALTADGVASDSPHFAELLADSTGISVGGRTAPVAAPAAAPASAAGQAAAAPTAEAVTTAKTELWRAGVDRLKSLTPGEQSRFAAFNKVAPNDLAEAYHQPSPPTPNKPEVDQFLIAVGYEQKIAAAKIAGTTLPVAQTKASESGNSAVRTPPALVTDAWLRNNGLSFATGVGLSHYGGDDQPIGTLIVRWNLWQRIATAKWNQRVGDNNGEGYAQVPFWGAVEYYDRNPEIHAINGRFKSARADAGTLPWLPEISFVGPFIGGAVAGEKITTRGDQERPYIVGASVGFGFYREAAPFVTFDFGKTVSPKHGLGSSSNYFGVSFDAIVLGSITGFIRKPAAPQTSGTPVTAAP